MIALKPVLSAWLEEAEAAKRDPDGSGGVLHSPSKCLVPFGLYGVKLP